MRNFLVFVLIVTGAFFIEALSASEQKSPSLVVVATRYLKAEGVSHAHLYLYEENGKFIRQLTHLEQGQEHNPMFSHDGKTITFVRTPDGEDGKRVIDSRSNTPTSIEYWQVNTDGRDMKRLPALPDWYQAATNAPYFQFWQQKGTPEDQPIYGHIEKWDANDTPLPGILDKPPASFTSPDGQFQLTLKLGTNDLDWNGPGNGELYELKNLKSGKVWRLGDLPGFVGLTYLQHASYDPHLLFLQQGALNVVFFNLHMGSTFGEASIALDLKTPKLVFLPGNVVPLSTQTNATPTQWNSLVSDGGNALPIPLPNEPAFFALCYKRYEPIPGSSKTANISYLARFDSTITQTPYVKIGTAPNFYGASLYRPDMTPAVLKIGEEIDDD